MQHSSLINPNVSYGEKKGFVNLAPGADPLKKIMFKFTHYFAAVAQR